MKLVCVTRELLSDAGQRRFMARCLWNVENAATDDNSDYQYGKMGIGSPFTLVHDSLTRTRLELGRVVTGFPWWSRWPVGRLVRL